MSVSTASPVGYTRVQIALHWAVVALVIVQYLTHDAMENFWDDIEDGGYVSFGEKPGALLHAASGAAILSLMLARLALRLRYGAPPLPADLHPLQALAAHISHFALYAVLLVLPLTGAAAVLLRMEDAADLHSSLTLVLWALIALHIAAAFYHLVIRRDGVFQRIFAAAGR
jgi:cytochrome b561